MVELLLAFELFSFKLKHRPKFWLRVAVADILCVGFALAFPISSYSSWFSSLMFLTFFLVTILAMSHVYKTEWRYLFFFGILSYTAQHISHEFFNLIGSSASFFTDQYMGMYGSIVLDWSNLNASFWLASFIYIDIYLLFYSLITFFLRKEFKNIEIRINNVSLLFLSAIILLVDIILNSIIVYIPTGYSKIYSIVTSIYAIICCLLVLYIQNSILNTKQLQKDLHESKQLLHLSQEQYKTSKKNIELINLKCHDLKHQIRSLRAKDSISPSTLSEIEKEIDIYDSSVKTGNEAVDVILTEKSLLCKKDQIKLTCMADCSGLSYISDSDLYSLLGNALDNAINAVMALPVESRNISLVIKKTNSFTSISIVNPYKGKLAMNEEGLPETSKNTDYHGYGMKSIKMIVEKYDGNLQIGAKDNVFSLSILF